MASVTIVNRDLTALGLWDVDGKYHVASGMGGTMTLDPDMESRHIISLLLSVGVVSDVSTAPTNTVAPSISGAAMVGQTLTATEGTWTGAPTVTLQWLRNGAAISGATGLTYVLTEADLGATISVRVTATNAGGSAQATSAGVGPVTEGGAAWYDDFTVSRASPLQAITYDGAIQNFASGELAVTDLGLRLTSASALRIADPTDLTAASWTKGGVTIATTEIFGPDGNIPAQRITADTSAGTAHYVGSAPTAKTNGTAYTMAAIVKREGHRYVQLSFSSATHGATRYANFDLQTLDMTQKGSGVSYADITPLADGWALIQITSNATITASGPAQIYLITSPTAGRAQTFTGAGETILIAGVCERVGEASLQQWQTTEVAATDVTKVLPAALSGSWTMVIEQFMHSYDNPGTYNTNNVPSNDRIVSLNAGAASPYYAVEAILLNGGVTLRHFNGAGGTSLVAEGEPIQYYPKSRRIAVVYNAEAGTFGLFVNGVKVGSAAGALPAGMVNIKVGRAMGDANRANQYVSDFKLLSQALTDNAAILETSRVASPPVINYETAAPRHTMRRYQGMPSIDFDSSKSVLWAVLTGQDKIVHSSGEGTGAWATICRSGDLGATWSEVAYALPGDKNVDLVGDPFLWTNPLTGKMYFLPNCGGSAVIQDGQYGVYVAELTNPTGAVPAFGPFRRIVNSGVVYKPFVASGQVYLPVAQWRGPSGLGATKPGVPEGKFIYRWDPETDAVTLHSTLPSGSNFTFDEHAIAVLDNGDWHAIWRTSTGTMQATYSQATSSWGAASAWTDITPTADSRSAYKRSPYSGRRVMVFNKSAPPNRSNMTFAVHDGSAWHQLTFNTDANISYPDMTCDEDGNWYIVHDFERTIGVGTGARAIKMAVINEDDVIAGTATATITTVNQPVGP